MRNRSIVLIAILLTAAIVVTGIALGQDDQGPAPAEPAEPFEVSVSNDFTYQGQLKSGGNPYNGKCDFQFKLYDASSGGSQIGSTITKANQTVTDGRFTVSLDFGSSAFQGSNRWLQILVRCPAGSGSYTTLTTRQKLTASPYALYANKSGNATNADTADFANDSDKLDNRDSTYFASQSALDTHDHMIQRVDKNNQSMTAIGFTEVLKITLVLPDKCSGASPVDNWNVFVTATGYLVTSVSSFSRLGLSMDAPTTVLNPTLRNTTLGPGDDARESWATHWLFTGVSSGSHDFRLLAERFSGGNHTVQWPVLTVEARGYSCAATSTVSVGSSENAPSDINDPNTTP